jgi:hypothetical protein
MTPDKPEFHEDFHSVRALTQAQDFDWESLYDALGETSATDVDELNRKLLSLLEWAVEPIRSRRTRKRRTETLARRVVALAWVVCPELFGQKSSMTDLATSLGMHKAVLSELTSAFSKRFGVRNNYQLGHGWNFKGKGKSNGEK